MEANELLIDLLSTIYDKFSLPTIMYYPDVCINQDTFRQHIIQYQPYLLRWQHELQSINICPYLKIAEYKVRTDCGLLSYSRHGHCHKSNVKTIIEGTNSSDYLSGVLMMVILQIRAILK
jgi:hypothetical protein